MTTSESDFEAKWREVLTRISSLSHEAYCTHVGRYGRSNLSTSTLPSEAQKNIDRYKKRITSSSVLVVNHAYCGYLLINGEREDPH